MPLKKIPFWRAFWIVNPLRVKFLTAVVGQTGLGPGLKWAAPTWMPSAKLLASMIAVSGPAIVMLSFKTVTVSRYVPGGTEMMSPGLAALTAAWILPTTCIMSAFATHIWIATHATTAARTSFPMA